MLGKHSLTAKRNSMDRFNSMGELLHMGVYNLDLDEVVLLQDSRVTTGTANVTLVLTNQNIIQVNRGIWLGNKGVWKYPLLELKTLNGKPNVRVGKDRAGNTQLELYFQGYEREYVIKGIFSERKWVGAIEKAYKAAVSELKKTEKAKRKTGEILSPIKTVFNNTMDAIVPKEMTIKTRMIKCPRCGAELTGEKGEEVKCSYCDMVLTIN